MAEYGLAPVNNHPGLTYAAVSEALVTSRWQAPEIVNRSQNGNGEPVVDSKAADVFAFGMFTVEVFTGKVPFEELKKNEEVVLRISRGSRPEKPQNAQAVGLTTEMWKFTESCWHQNPKKRPNVEEVVKRWQKFVESNGHTGCVQINLLIRLSSSSISIIDLGRRCSRQVPHQALAGLMRDLMLPNLRQNLRPHGPE